MRSLRSLTLSLLVAALLLGALPMHTGTHRHDGAEGIDSFWSAAGSPDGTQSIESALGVNLDRCVACILQLKTRCAGIASACGAPQMVVLRQSPQDEPESKPVSLASCSCPRGPPLA